MPKMDFRIHDERPILIVSFQLICSELSSSDSIEEHWI